MKSLNFPILTMAGGLIAGVLLLEHKVISGNQLPYLLLLFFLLLLVWGLLRLYKRHPFLKGSFSVILFCFFLIIGNYLHQINSPLGKENHYAHLREYGKSQVLVLSIVEALRPSSFYDKYVIEIHKINGTPTVGKALLNIPNGRQKATLLPADSFLSYASFTELPTAKNPYEFDYGTYLKRQGIYSQLAIDIEELIPISSSQHSLILSAGRFRESVRSALRTYPFTEDQLAIIDALLLGQRTGISQEIRAQYVASGMMHILAVSGLHVGIILLLMRGLLRFMRYRKLRILQAVLVIIGIWLFAFITGLSPSVQRAATMFTFFELGNLLHRRQRGYNSLLYAGLFLMLYDTELLFQIGFQLSFLAVFFIIWWHPMLSNWYRPRFWLEKHLWQILTVSIAAQMGVLPLSFYYFHQFPGLFLVSNLIVLPFLGLIIGLGILIVIGAYTNTLPIAVAKVYAFIIDLLNQFINWVASQENFQIKYISISFMAVIFLYLFIIGIGQLLQGYTYKRLLIAFTSALLLLSVGVFEKWQPPHSHLAIYNMYRNTSIGHLDNELLTLYTNDTTFPSNHKYTIAAYRNALPIKGVRRKELQNVFRFRGKQLLVIDKFMVYEIDLVPDVILLTQSPDLNLNRLIRYFPNSTIVADGSNYPSDISYWKNICAQNKIPFHSTYEKGAYIID